MLLQSAPYAIIIKNRNNFRVHDIDIFGAWTNLYSGKFNNAGDYVFENGVKISGFFSNVSYQYFLSQSNINPFSVGATQIIGDITQPSVINQTMELTSIDANGDAVTTQLLWVLNPFQNIGGTVINYTAYSIDGSTTLTIPSMAPNASFIIYFYPSAVIDTASNLINEPAMQQYEEPALRPACTVILGK